MDDMMYMGFLGHLLGDHGATTVKVQVGPAIGVEAKAGSLGVVEAKVTATVYGQCNSKRCVTGLEAEGALRGKVGKLTAGPSAGVQQELADTNQGASRWRDPHSTRLYGKLRDAAKIGGVDLYSRDKDSTSVTEDDFNSNSSYGGKACLGSGCLTVQVDPAKLGHNWNRIFPDVKW
jgi:hypothetical protein